MQHYIFVRNQSRSLGPLLLLVSLCRAPDPTKLSYALGIIKMIEIVIDIVYPFLTL